MKRLFSFLLILLVLCGPVLAAPPPLFLGNTQGTARDAGAAIAAEQSAMNAAMIANAIAGTSQVWRPIGIRGQYAMLGLSDGRRSCATYRQYFNVSNRAATTGIKLRYSNAWGSSTNGTENDGPNNLTITASVETNSAQNTGIVFINNTHKIFGQALFSTKTSGFLAKGGGHIDTDPLPIPLVAGSMVYVNTYVCADGNGQYPFTAGVRNPVAEQTNSGFSSQSVSITNSTTAGGTLSYTSTTGVALTPLLPNTLWITGPGITGTAADNGSGVITGTGVTGTVNYSTGAWALTFPTAQTGAYAVSGYFGPTVTPDDTMVALPQDTQGLFQDAFGPSEVLTLQAPLANKQPFGNLDVGDSIMGDVGNQDNLSFADYCAMTAPTSNVPNFGSAKIAQFSETATNFITNHNRRLALANGEFDRITYEYGSNDASGGESLATLEASTLTNWALLAAYLPNGQKSIYASTLFPRTTGVDGQTPVAGMGPGPSTRNGYDAWLFTEAQAGVIGGVIDVAAGTENSPGSQTGTGDGKWKSSTFTSEGIHVTLAGDLAACAIVGAYGSNPSPAFIAPY